MTFNLENLGIKPRELYTRNVTDIPIEKIYYISYRTMQMCIHLISNKYYIYTMNFIPKYYIENHYKEFTYNTWTKITGNKDINIVIRQFQEYAKEMLGIDKPKKINLDDIIEYLKTLNEINKGINNEID